MFTRNRIHLVTALAAVFISGLAARGAAAQGALSQPFFGSKTESTSAPAPGQEVQVEFHANKASVHPGDNFVVAVVLNHAAGWHSWPSLAQDVLPKEIAEFVIRTEAGVAGAIPAWVRAIGAPQWPEPHNAPVANPLGGKPIEVKTYQGRAIVYLPILVAPDAASGEQSLDLRAFFQACNEVMCLAPRTETATLSFTVVPIGRPIAEPRPSGSDSPERTEGDASSGENDELFSAFDPSSFAAMAAASPTGQGVSADGADGGTTNPDSSRNFATDAPEAHGSDSRATAENTSPARSFFGIDIPRGDGIVGIALLAVLAMLGGFILNLTPCVLPVIPIKVMTLSQHAGSPGKAIRLALWMSAGVIAFWLGIGLPVAVFGAATDPSRIFGIWWVTLGIGLLITAMAVGIMGLFTINLPQRVYMVNPKADSAGGSFLFGVMTAVLGLPCFGFVAGALLAGAATLPAVVVLVIFGSLGVGMALPYLVLAAKPSLVDRLPRTGPASELVKQVMGLLMMAAAAYFIGAGLIGLVSEQPWMSRQLHWWAALLFAAIAGGWLMLRTFQITTCPIRRTVFSIGSIGLVALAALYVADSTRGARQNYLLREAAFAAAGGDDGGLVPGVWNEYDPEKVDAAIASGQIVVLDFTAEWCLNCKALKAAVLDRDPVRSVLAGKDVIPVEVDLTSTKAPGWEALRALGQTGIPLLVVYGPGHESGPWQANAYTSPQVMEAIEKARGAAGATVKAVSAR